MLQACRHFFITLCVFLISQMVSAQEVDSVLNNEPDVYIESLAHLISLKTNINNDLETFILDAPGTRLDLRPNTNLANSYNFSYEFIIFSFSYNPGFVNLNADQQERGKTSIIRYGTDLNVSPYFIQHLSFQRISGFYLENTEEYLLNWREGEPYLQFPELDYISWRGKTTYRPNKNYSIFAMVASNQRQVRSAGSPVFDLSYRYYQVVNRTPLTETNSRQRSRNLEAIVSAGYSYSLVVKRNFYVTGGASAGAGLVRTRLLTEFQDQQFINYDFSDIYKLEGFLATGYDNGIFFTGTKVSGLWTERYQASGGSAVFNNLISFEVFIGYRLQPPERLRKTTRYLRDLLPFI